jgi:hypothetical protein
VKRESAASSVLSRRALLEFALAGAAAVAAGPRLLSDSPRQLRVDGRAFRLPDGSRFAWRGVTSFRLLEFMAHGRRADLTRTLDWAARSGVTIVRVLAMCDRLFKLAPDEGRRALPAFLSLAAERGLRAEVVALADTDVIPVSLDEQVTAVGAVCARHANAVLEIANEPYAGQSHRADIADPALLGRLRTLVPAGVLVALGASSRDDSPEYAAGDFVTVHLSRAPGERGWGHVLQMNVTLALSAATGKPVVDDEPIGAAERDEHARRDGDAGRWFAKGVLARLLGLGATFHYEDGLQSRVPRGRQEVCFAAWRRGLDLLPAAFEDRAQAVGVGSPRAAVAAFDRGHALDVVLRQGEREAWAAAVGCTGDPGIRWSSGWRATRTVRRSGVVVQEARR